MREKLRKSGLGVVGDIPWGTHLCQFFQTGKDLTDILVPYFKAGLENNEFCMWVTTAPLGVEDARSALKRKVKNLDGYIRKGQIEILDYSQWYIRRGKFDAQEVLGGWVKKERKALRRGFEGLRLTGNTAWLEKKDWGGFTEYEETINNVIGKHRMLAICSYSLDKCGSGEIIDVVSNHQFALIRKFGKWESIETSKYKKLKEEIASLAKFPSENPEPVLRVSKDGTLLYANKASKALLDQWKCAVGKPFPVKWQKLIKDVFGGDERGRGVEIELEGRTLFFRLVPIREFDYLNIYGIDITERKRLEDMRNGLIQNVSHELKTPIAMAKMAYGMVRRAIQARDMEQIRKAQIISFENVKRLETDINNILRLFTLRPTKKIEEKMWCFLTDITDDVLNSLRYIIDEKRLKVKVEIRPNAYKILANKDDLKTVLYNIVENAVKFTKKGGISIATRPKGKWLQIIIKDTGRGIDKKHLDKIFERFYKEHPAIPGAGLGLAICNDIVKMYGGKIEVTSNGIGKGAKVAVSLPRK